MPHARLLGGHVGDVDRPLARRNHKEILEACVSIDGLKCNYLQGKGSPVRDETSCKNVETLPPARKSGKRKLQTKGRAGRGTVL